MRADFLREPRSLELFDPLVERYQNIRFSFLEEDVLAELWARGEDCHLGEDERFKNTRWGRWCLQHHRLANQELITRLIQSWDGQQLHQVLENLDASEGGRWLVDLGDPRVTWDGHRLRLKQLPIHLFEHPAGTCYEGWLPLWRCSQWDPVHEPPPPLYMRLRRPLRPDHFALFVDVDGALAALGSLLLCSENGDAGVPLGWDESRLVLGAEVPLAGLAEEILLKDLYFLRADDNQSLETATFPMEEALARLTRGNSPTKRKQTVSPSRRVVARWVLDSMGALYCQIHSRLPDDVSLLLADSGQRLAPGQLLAQPLGAQAVPFELDSGNWSLPGLDIDRATLFLASTRERSPNLKTRCLPANGARRWLVPPSLGPVVSPLLEIPGVSVLSIHEGWMALEVETDPWLLPDQALDALGLTRPSTRTVLSFRGATPESYLDDEEGGEMPIFSSGDLPHIWVDPRNADAGQAPHLLLAGPDQLESIPLRGDPPWRIDMMQARPGRYHIQFLDRQRKVQSPRVAFEIVAESSTPRPYPSPGWLCGSAPWTPPEVGCDLGQMPDGLALVGPPAWPVQVEWQFDGQVKSLERTLDRQGRLDWIRIGPYLGLARTGTTRVDFHLRGLARLSLIHRREAPPRDWSQLSFLTRTRFWSLRSLAALSQRWEHLVLPILAQAQLRASQQGPNLWSLVGCTGPNPLYLCLARRKDWDAVAGQLPESLPGRVLLSDGIHWGLPEVSLEDCLSLGNFTPLQSLLNGGLQA